MRRFGKAGFTAAAGLMACLYLALPVSAAESPLISGTETEADADPAYGPAVDTGTEESSDTEENQSSYTEEQLNDNVVEYGELEELVRRGNVTALNSENSYQTSLAVYEEAYNTMVSGIGDMNYKADELEDEGGDEALIAVYEQNADILSSSAKQYRRSLESLNSVSNQASRDRIVWEQVKMAQSLLGTCVQMEAQTASVEKTAEASQAACDRKVAERAAGLCTEEELLEAEETLLAAQTAALQTKSQADSSKRQLGILIGKNGSSLELGEIPAVTEDELEALDLDSDRAMAVIADSTVKSLRSSSATGDAERRSRENRLEDAKGTASITIDEQYQEIASLSLARDAAQAAYEAAEKDYHALQIKYQSGAINKGDYLTGEAEYYQKKADMESAEASLRAAYDSYQWMLKGV